MLSENCVGLAETLFFTRSLILLFLILVCAIEDGAEKPAVKSRLVNHNRILLIVTSICSNCDYNIVSGRHILRLIVSRHVGRHERNIEIAEQICHRIHAVAKVQSIDTHGLLTHRCLVRVSRRLVVVGERNVRCHCAIQDTRMDFTMRVRFSLFQIIRIHRNIEVLSLGGVNIFHHIVACRSLKLKEIIPFTA